ncbi:s-adenosylmethionine trna ribosyltransferase [Diplodia corticola]|uniref:S-adenosylmethionine trna ribosyltransferase n=1 Tax=Diplodia corticola TaxID=236234 RepID=A0A1J9RGR5_9PEZI|nr:s-adenosylmethionine trna ribosyltransferase [Diplodia corticola]OJD31731.1 s-adenosylmethionine trna ribosyltransferase [Diplodia corticola]
MDPPDALLRERLRALLDQRQHPKTICPSEVARSLTAQDLADLGADGWRDLMPVIRILVFEARAASEVEILQRGAIIGQEVPADTIRGPIRVRKLRESETD